MQIFLHSILKGTTINTDNNSIPVDQVKHKYTGQIGYPDINGNVWVPTGLGPVAHGDPHWDVITNDGKYYWNVMPAEKIRSNTSDNYLTCKKVHFYSQLDESIFFHAIKQIACIEKIEGIKDELYLDLVSCPLNYHDMKDLIALMVRYTIEMSQLAPFVNEDNEAAIEPWKKQVYKSK